MKARYTSLIFAPLVLADAEFLSINLKGWQGCNNAQSAKISVAWENAVKMAAAVKDNVDLNEAASVEYFGPPAFSADYVDEIRGVFSNEATFSQGSKWVPTPLKWDAYVRCDDWKGNCNTYGVAAYNVNKMGTPEGHSCQQSSQPAFWQKPAGLVFYGVFGRLDGLIGCGDLAGLTGLIGLTPN